VKLEVRYARSFLKDLQNLESAAYEQIYKFVFYEFMEFNRIQDLPELHCLSTDAIFYRFSVDRYLIGIEVTGQIVKFLRVLPKPDI
jgi:mRNA-degrading endonuclease RelE of RelBE toxin-antitoxin system